MKPNRSRFVIDLDRLESTPPLTPEEVEALVGKEGVPPEKWIEFPVADHGDLDRPVPKYEDD